MLQDTNKRDYNFVFMFSSPSYKESVYYHKVDKSITFAHLNYQHEYHLIRKSLKKHKIEINVNKEHGTIENFQKIIMSGKTRAIHFSGHAKRKEDIKKENIELRKRHAI